MRNARTAASSGPLVLAVDQGTSAPKATLVDGRGDVVAHGRAPVSLSTPAPGWVEQPAEEIRQSCRRAVVECPDGQDASRVVTVGLSTRRESLLLWERATGTHLSPLVGWTDERTVGDPALLRASDAAELVRDWHAAVRRSRFRASPDEDPAGRVSGETPRVPAEEPLFLAGAAPVGSSPIRADRPASRTSITGEGSWH